LEPGILKVNIHLTYLSPGGDVTTFHRNLTFYRVELVGLTREVKYVVADERITWQPEYCITYSGVLRRCVWLGNATGVYTIISPVKLVVYYKPQFRFILNGKVLWQFLDENIATSFKITIPLWTIVETHHLAF